MIVAYHPFSLPVFTYVQFSGVGIPTTQAPTILVMGAAAVAVVVSNLRLPAGLTPARAPEPAPRPPDARPRPGSASTST